MKRVASLFLPQLAIERLRRMEQPILSRPEARRPAELLVDDDPGACSIPRGGNWRPGARWARESGRTREQVDAEVTALPVHRQPPMRELGRRSEAADHPFRRVPAATAPAFAPPLASAAPARRPLALAAAVGRRQEIVAACPVSLALGVGVGMAVTHARVLVPDLDLRPADLEADAHLLERLALRSLRSWTPIAAVCEPDGLWLDLTGGAHLFGGEERFCRRLVAFCARTGFTARIAVADTPGAAYALARHGPDAVITVLPGGTLEHLLPLPVSALRLSTDALVAARRFGFDRIGDLLPVARGPLARRLGLMAVQRLDQALGRVPEPLVSVTDPGAPQAERRLLEPISTVEAIRQVMSDLLADLVATLRERGLGARTLRLVCFRVDGEDQTVSAGTSRPTRDPVHLLRLMALRIEGIEPGLGLEGFQLTAVYAEPLGAASLGAVLAGEPELRDIPRLVDGAVGRVGPQAVFRVAPVESHVPERAVMRADPLSAPAGWPAWKRPARLLARPEPLSGVVALLPDQPPRRFQWRGATHRVVAADGPERIHGEWWRRKGEIWAVRDYFRLEDEVGARFWVFRRGDGVEADTGDLSWWMHGLFG